MAREYAKVASQFWIGRTGKELRGNLVGQVIAAYLITCPGANALGLYYLPIPTLSHETGIPPKGALKALRRLSEGGFCLYDASSEWVFIPEMARFQIGERLEPNDNRVKWLKRELETLRRSPFFNHFLDRYQDAFHLQDIDRVEAPPEGLQRDNTLSLSLLTDQKGRDRPKSEIEIWFESEFIPAYPKHRRVQEKKALTAFRKLQLGEGDRAAVLSRLAKWKLSSEWTKSNGDYVPGMHTFLSDGYYNREPIPANGNGNNGARSTRPEPRTVAEARKDD